MKGLFTKPVLLPRPKKSFYQKPTPLTRYIKLAHPPIGIFVEDVDRFEVKEMMERRPFTKSTRYDWLMHYIPESIKKWLVVIRKRLWVFLKQTQPKIIIKMEKNQENQKHKKKKKQSEDNIIKNVRNLFQVLKENEAIKYKIIRNIRTLFESKKRRKLLPTSKCW